MLEENIEKLNLKKDIEEILKENNLSEKDIIFKK